MDDRFRTRLIDKMKEAVRVLEAGGELSPDITVRIGPTPGEVEEEEQELLGAEHE